MNQEIDSVVLLNFQTGDPHAFKQVYNHFYQRLYYFSKKIVANQEDAEDIVLNTFIKLFERHQHFNSFSNIKAFLYIAIRNACLDNLRAAKWRNDKQKEYATTIQDEYNLKYEYEIEGELLEAIHTAINDLPDVCQKIFKMLYFEELKPAAIAKQLNISVDTVYSQKRRALQILRMALVENQMLITWLVYVALYMQFVFLIE